MIDLWNYLMYIISKHFDYFSLIDFKNIHSQRDFSKIKNSTLFHPNKKKPNFIHAKKFQQVYPSRFKCPKEGSPKASIASKVIFFFPYIQFFREDLSQ